MINCELRRTGEFDGCVYYLPSWGAPSGRLMKLVAERFNLESSSYDIICQWSLAASSDQELRLDRVCLGRFGSEDEGMFAFYRVSLGGDGVLHEWIHVPLMATQDLLRKHQDWPFTFQKRSLTAFQEYVDGILPDPAAWEPIAKASRRRGVKAA